MNPEQLELLKEIMKVQFAAVETALYLDTHPEDMRVLTEHNRYACTLDMLKRQYVQKFGPLTSFDPSICPWKWIESPWPWEINY